MMKINIIAYVITINHIIKYANNRCKCTNFSELLSPFSSASKPIFIKFIFYFYFLFFDFIFYRSFHKLSSLSFVIFFTILFISITLIIIYFLLILIIIFIFIKFSCNKQKIGCHQLIITNSTMKDMK